MTLLVIAGLVICWGFSQWPLPVRNWWRLACFSASILILLCAFIMARGYRERFVTYGGLHHVVSTGEDADLYSEVMTRLRRTTRGRMYVGAWRAWQSAPWLGTGLGMHRHFWPAFADSGDGDRASGQWPTLINDEFHSYEVHSDWLELLQELGVWGFVLFCVGLCGTFGVLYYACRTLSLDWKRNELAYSIEPPDNHFTFVLSALLAIGAMAFHSLGDFNLQMPGTVWMLGLIIGCGMHAAGRVLHPDP
jgi:O-antigen ligase